MDTIIKTSNHRTAASKHETAEVKHNTAALKYKMAAPKHSTAALKCKKAASKQDVRLMFWHKRKHIAAVLVAAVMLALLAGCVGKFDAGGYTQAILDVTYKNVTEQYIEITGSTKEAAEQIFTKNLDIAMEDFESLNLPDELEDKYRQLFGDLIKNVRYTVGEAKEDDNGNFTVDVTIEPLTIFDDTYEEFQKQAKEYATQVSNDVMNGAEMPSDETMQNHIYELYYNILNGELGKGLNYSEAEVVTVHVNKGEADIYEIPGEDMTALDDKMLSRKVLEGV